MNSKIIFILLITCFLFNVKLTNSFFPAQKQKIEEINSLYQNPLPFDGLFLEYELKVRSNYSRFWIPLDFKIEYRDNNTIPELFQLQGFDYLMKITASTVLSSSYTENATFYINSVNRTMILDETLIEGFLVENYLILIYNGNPNVINYNPFWINPSNLSINQKISVFSFNFTITNSFTQDYDDLGYKKIWIANFKDVLFNEIQNITSFYDLVVIYDVHTGILLQGSLNGTFKYENGSISNYEMDFILSNNTNAFEVFPIDPLSLATSSSTDPIVGLITNPEPNFLLLMMFLWSPIAITLFNFARIRKIDGGI